MRDLYLGKIVDITDGQCEFIEEFNKEIEHYGAIVYNQESNSYQYIRQFEHIDCKKEVLPDFIKVENTDPLLKGLKITIHYEFDPEIEEDEENLDIWNNEISQMELPYYNYDEDGEFYVEKMVPMTTAPSLHTVWFLKKESLDYIMDTDLLMLTPIIKNLNIARELIKKYAVHPFENEYDENDSFQQPFLKGVYSEEAEKAMFEQSKKK